MPTFSYSLPERLFDPKKFARAFGRELPISPKKTVELCRAIRGMKVPDARDYLERVARMEQAVPYRRYNRWVAHKPGIGPGRYPVKSAKAVLKIVESAAKNATDQDMEPEEMRIRVISPHRGRIRKGFMPRAHGTSGPWNQETVNLEIILEKVS